MTVEAVMVRRGIASGKQVGVHIAVSKYSLPDCNGAGGRSWLGLPVTWNM